MTASNFQKLLFKSAAIAMAVDGKVHDDEILELEALTKQTPYFFDFAYENELDKNLRFIQLNGKDAVNKCLNEICVSDLSSKQQLILIEVLLRILDADKKFDPNEIKFLQLVISQLHVDEETLVSKFPNYLQYLIGFDRHLNTHFDVDLKIS